MISLFFIGAGYLALIATVGPWYGFCAIVTHILIMVLSTRKIHHG